MQAAFRLVEGALPPQIQAVGTWQQLFFQGALLLDTFHFMLAMFIAAWGRRGVVRESGAILHLAYCIARGIITPSCSRGHRLISVSTGPFEFNHQVLSLAWRRALGGWRL